MPVLGGLAEFQKNSFIEDESDPKVDIKNILHSQIKDHEAIIGYIREHLSYVESFKDGASADFLNKRLAIHEKMAWMLRSSL